MIFESYEWFVIGASIASGSSFWNTKSGENNKSLIDNSDDNSEVSVRLSRDSSTVRITRRTGGGQR